MLAGAGVIVGEHMAGVSSDATVNARLLVVRAPIDGDLALRGHGIGAHIGRGEPLASVRDTRVDPGRLLELVRSEAFLHSDISRLETLLAGVTRSRDTFAGEAERYRSGRLAQLERRLAEAGAAREAAATRVREVAAALKRAIELGERGVQSPAALDRVRAAHEIAGHELESARQRVAYLSVELDAARQGTFLGDSYNDAPFSIQRMRDLEQRIVELGAELRHARVRLAQTSEQIAAEQVRLAALTAAEIAAPAAGMVWDHLAASGEVVRKGQDLMRIVDCSSLMVTAGVGERLYNSLGPGDRARFRLLGGERAYAAVVVRLGGSGGQGLYQGLAVAPTAEHLEQYDVVLAVPELAAEAADGCPVGRTGRVVFSARPLAALEQVAMLLGL